MEREMCALLQWNLNIQGHELSDFSARIRSEHGSHAAVATSSASVQNIVPAVNPCLAPDTTRNAFQSGRQLPPTYDSRPQQVVESQLSFPSQPTDSRPYRLTTTPHASQPLHVTSAGLSLVSSPASSWMSPSPVIVTPNLCDSTSMTDARHLFNSKSQQCANSA
jgi:hypothetical protein